MVLPARVCYVSGMGLLQQYAGNSRWGEKQLSRLDVRPNSTTRPTVVVVDVVWGYNNLFYLLVVVVLCNILNNPLQMWYNQPMKKLTPNTNETPDTGKMKQFRHFVTEG